MNTAEHYAVTEHARIRLFERGITLDDAIICVANGEIIEQYENDTPLPSCLVLGMEIKGRYIHIRNVPCYKCTECNEITYMGDVLKKLEEIISHAKKLMQEISIIDYSKVA